MKLRSLTLSNVRKFAGQSATISAIGDGVSVVSEANEFGKSTFFDALHALFFLKYGAATREVKSLQPRSGGAVRVSAQIELPEGLFTLEKSFLAQKRASVKDASGTVIALDDEAERWIAQLMGNGIEGPAGLLWVRQGTTALEPGGTSGAEKTEKERLLGARRDLLSSVAGEIDMVTGGRRMDRVIEAAMQSLGRLATATGIPKANGPWKLAEQEAHVLTDQHAELERVCLELSDALVQRREVAMRLEMLEAPGTQEALTAALEAAQIAHKTAQDHAEKLAQVQDQVALRCLEMEGAQARLDKLIAAAEGFEHARTQLSTAQAAYSEAAQNVRTAEAATNSAQTALVKASSALASAQAAKETLQHEALHKNAVEKHEQLQARLAQMMQKRNALEQANAALATQTVTPQTLEQIEQAQADLARVQAEAAAGGVQMHLDYDTAQKVSSKDVPLEAGAHRVGQRAVFDLPGIGRMTLDPGDAAADMAAVEKAKTALRTTLDAVGMANVDTARRSAALRRDTMAEIALLKNVQETLAPEGLERLQAAVAQALAAVEASTTSRTKAQHDPAEVARQLEAAQQAEHAARATYDNSRDKRDAARAALARAQALRDAAQSGFDLAAATYGDPDEFEGRKAQAARDCALAGVAVEDANAASEALQKDAPDLANAQADLARATSASENAREERLRLKTRIADLGATIRARAEDGVEEKRDEVAGLLQAATERAARFEHEAAGLMLLVEALRAKRGAAQEAYFGPVRQELAPLLALLHADAALSFDPTSLLPQGLARGGADEPLDMLSGGTQEQIAILTRLAFARLFARQGKPMPIILDDALVYSDDNRILAMFTALHRVAADQQVIVFSCRQMAFAGLGGTRPVVEITQDR
ncbi:AAA family ATPase [Sulfitobacter sp.]|uniref:AAA family ATPase n=1 Tax=Sulfitobacter sp. TaxID=1903071 RepID=UPI0030018A6E